MNDNTSPLLEVTGLTVDFAMNGARRRAVDTIDFSVARGEVLAIVGESGSGKSVTALSILGLLPGNAQTTGSIRLDGTELLAMPEAPRRKAMARRIAVIFQDPANALDPVYNIGFQLVETIRLHHPKMSRAQATARGVELLSMVGIPEPERRMRYYPHQFSGGQCQRIMIAMALAGEPELLIADEPTTALDVTVQAGVLDLLRELRADLNTAIVIITHDMGVVADFADRVVVMRHGELVEEAEVEDLFYEPIEEYTRELLAAVPRIDVTDRRPRGETLETAQPVLSMRDVVVEFGGGLGGARFRAVDGVGLAVQPGEFVGLVGESGSGKSTLGRVALGAIQAVSGTVITCGEDIGRLNRSKRKELARRTAMVFQNPTSSLDPRYTAGESVAESLIVHQALRGTELKTRVAELLEQVGLPGSWAARYPHEMSGGQRQRVSIARAISVNPELLIADEPTSALDVSVQARVLDLFRELQEDLRFACLFISHDLAVVDQVCDRVAVMKQGRLVEEGPTEKILRNPTEAYTRGLIAASPVPDPRVQRARREQRALAQAAPSKETDQ